MMGDPLGAVIVDPSDGLFAFLSHFDLLEFNSLIMGHFVALEHPILAFFASSCLLKVFYSWRSYSRFMGISPLDLEEVYSWVISCWSSFVLY